MLKYYINITDIYYNKTKILLKILGVIYMEILKREKIGKIDFFGQSAIAFREIYTNGEWKFVIVANSKRIVLITY